MPVKFGYQSSEDAEVMLLGHRYYDPSTGRFLTRDPIKDGRNWYGYCRANPLSFADRNGLEPFKLPQNPSGLHEGWWKDPRHGNGIPGSERWFPPEGGGNGLEWHEGKPGAPGHQAEDHWHEVKEGPKGKPEKVGDHVKPWTEVDLPGEAVPSESPASPMTAPVLWFPDLDVFDMPGIDWGKAGYTAVIVIIGGAAIMSGGTSLAATGAICAIAIL